MPPKIHVLQDSLLLPTTNYIINFFLVKGPWRKSPPETGEEGCLVEISGLHLWRQIWWKSFSKVIAPKISKNIQHSYNLPNDVLVYFRFLFLSQLKHPSYESVSFTTFSCHNWELAKFTRRPGVLESFFCFSSHEDCFSPFPVGVGEGWGVVTLCCVYSVLIWMYLVYWATSSLWPLPVKWNII